MMSSNAHREAYRNAVDTIESVDNNGRKKYVVNRNPKGGNEVGAKTIRVTQSYLRSEIILNPNLTNYSFGILDRDIPVGATGLFPTEQRLKQQDVFFTYSLGFYILCASTSGGNTSFLYELMTFPNPNFYGSFGINLDLMVGLWTSGSLQVSVNNDVLTPAWDLKKHFFVPETQINTTTWPANSAYFNEVNYEHNGHCIVEPNWIINGGNNNQYVITYPQSISNIGLTSGNFRLVLDWRGFLAQNCSSLMDNK